MVPARLSTERPYSLQSTVQNQDPTSHPKSPTQRSRLLVRFAHQGHKTHPRCRSQTSTRSKPSIRVSPGLLPRQAAGSSEGRLAVPAPPCCPQSRAVKAPCVCGWQPPQPAGCRGEGDGCYGRVNARGSLWALCSSTHRALLSQPCCQGNKSPSFLPGSTKLSFSFPSASPPRVVLTMLGLWGFGGTSQHRVRTGAQMPARVWLGQGSPGLGPLHRQQRGGRKGEVAALMRSPSAAPS